jgi:hypothetical protein
MSDVFPRGFTFVPKRRRDNYGFALKGKESQQVRNRGGNNVSGMTRDLGERDEVLR